MQALQIILTAFALLLALTSSAQALTSYLDLTPLQLMAEYGKVKGGRSFTRNGGMLKSGATQEVITWYEPESEITRVFLVLDKRVVVAELRTSPRDYYYLKTQLDSRFVATADNSWVDFSTRTNWTLRLNSEMTTLQVLKCSPCGK